MPKPAVKWLTWYFPALDNGNMLSYAACECSDYFRRLLLQLSPKYSLWLQIELSKTKYEDVSLNPRLHVVNNSVSNYRKNWRTSNRRTRVRYDCVTVLLSGKSLIFKVPIPKVVCSVPFQLQPVRVDTVGVSQYSVEPFSRRFWLKRGNSWVKVLTRAKITWHKSSKCFFNRFNLGRVV